MEKVKSDDYQSETGKPALYKPIKIKCKNEKCEFYIREHEERQLQDKNLHRATIEFNEEKPISFNTLTDLVEDRVISYKPQKYITGIASALKFLHKGKLIHGNLNPNNVVIGKELEVRLASPKLEG